MVRKTYRGCRDIHLSAPSPRWDRREKRRCAAPQEGDCGAVHYTAWGEGWTQDGEYTRTTSHQGDLGLAGDRFEEGMTILAFLFSKDKANISWGYFKKYEMTMLKQVHLDDTQKLLLLVSEMWHIEFMYA